MAIPLNVFFQPDVGYAPAIYLFISFATI